MRYHEIIEASEFEGPDQDAEHSACCDLIKYTQFSYRTLSPKTVAFLRRANYRERDDVVLYRGITIESDDLPKGKQRDSTAVDEICEKYFGVPASLIRPGVPCKYISPRRISSWSHSAKEAEAFTADYRRGNQWYGRILLKATVPASQVLCDLAMVPKLDQLYAEQQEVIVDRGILTNVTVLGCAFRNYHPEAETGWKWGHEWNMRGSLLGEVTHTE